MIRPTSILTEAFKVVAMATLLPLQGFGCGVDFKVPKDHFDGVNEYGYVSYWDKIADLDLGEGLVMPLVIGFQSDREWSSPYLGYGWILPLFDSNLVQTGENSFEMIAPDGYTVQFGRDGKKPTLLNGQRGLKGEISGDTIALWADCGWKLTYTKGKITSIGTPKGKTLLIGRDGTGVARDVTYDGKVVVRVEKDFKGSVTGLVLGDKRIGLEQTEKPRIQSILGKNVVAGKDMSLGKVSSNNGVIKTCEYTVTDELQPKLTVTDAGKSPRQIAWDSATRLIKADGEWGYDIKPSLAKNSNASIGRKNKTNQEELWFLDSAEGQEIVQEITGYKKVTRWFTSGNLTGKVRSIEQTSSSGHQSKKIFYDENCKVIRESIENGIEKQVIYHHSRKMENDIVVQVRERNSKLLDVKISRLNVPLELYDAENYRGTVFEAWTSGVHYGVYDSKKIPSRIASLIQESHLAEELSFYQY